MKKVSFIFAVTLLASMGANASISSDQQLGKYLNFSDPTTYEIPEALAPAYQMEGFDNYAIEPSTPSPIKIKDLDFNDIINIGKQIWKVIDDGKPVVNIKTDVAHALPRGVGDHWSELTKWQLPTSKTYLTVYRNGFDTAVIQFAYRVMYTYGGQFEGRGRYLSNITVVPAKLEVSWGYRFDVEAGVPQVMNIGSREEPIAGAEVRVRWMVRTPMKEGNYTDNYKVAGDGRMERMD